MHGVVVRTPGMFGPIVHAALEAEGMTFVAGEGYKWFPNATKFADLSWNDIERWMRGKERRSRAKCRVTGELPWTVEGFRARLKLEKQGYQQMKAAGAIGWIATEIFWPQGLCEALENDFPVEFKADYSASRDTITKNFEKILGPFVVCGKYRQMQVTT